MQATVYKSTGSWYQVKAADGNTYKARIKGVFKIDGISSTNPIAVGDTVTIEFENTAENTVVINAIEPRKNYIARVSPHNKNAHHIVASNLTQSLLFATLKSPKTSSGFIDRFLVSAESQHVPAILIFNKADLYKQKELDTFEQFKETYTSCGYQVYLCSLFTGEGLEQIKHLLQNQITLLTGHSGVGKSTYINTLFPQLSLRTQEVSDWSGKGLHTTTFAEMFDVPGGGQLIDTPGIRELGVFDIERTELAHYFPEMRAAMHLCQFNNCMHINEPNCAIKEAVNMGAITVDRYASYLSILETMPKPR
ncbi:MAG: ribosome small subunit-dependent GTPase A [Bacteroidetes bacterium]|nr:MAG: ribosome small subunit-dependent GTPase A [Bacteroidota bacterium]